MAVNFNNGNYQVIAGTGVRKITNVETVQSESGKYRQIKMGSIESYECRVVCGPLTDSEMETMSDWMVSNEISDDWDVDIGTLTYRGRQRGDVSVNLWGGSSHLWQLSFTLVGVKL